jgi:hypothetical protein
MHKPRHGNLAVLCLFMTNPFDFLPFFQDAAVIFAKEERIPSS